MIRRFLISLLFKLLFKGDYIQPINERKRILVFLKINKDADIVELFQSLYTRAYQSMVFDWTKGPDKYEMGVYIGRVIELMHILDMIETAPERLNNLEKIEKRREKIQQLTKKGQQLFKKGIEFINKPKI